MKSPFFDAEVLAAEINDLLDRLIPVARHDIKRIYLFGSAAKGISAMHQYSDIDLCVVLRDSVDIKNFRRKIPVSRNIPVDWIIVNEREFQEKSRGVVGTYSQVVNEGKVLFEAEATDQ